jgi:hypothetical protein
VFLLERAFAHDFVFYPQLFQNDKKSNIFSIIALSLFKQQKGEATIANITM